MPSVADAARHFPAEQSRLTQSLATLQVSPVPHAGAVGPPQPTSVSVLHVPPTQLSPVAQSAATEQDLPSAHGGHDPPQSTSVSVPFLTPSVQLGAAS
jgi:hypothetical protein